MLYWPVCVYTIVYLVFWVRLQISRIIPKLIIPISGILHITSRSVSKLRRVLPKVCCYYIKLQIHLDDYYKDNAISHPLKIAASFLFQDIMYRQWRQIVFDRPTQFMWLF